MAPVLDVLHVVSPAVAGLLVASVWQSVLLTGTVAVCVRYFPGMPAGIRFGLWMAVLALVVLLPAASLLVPHVRGAQSSAMHLANDWSLGLVCFWAVLSLSRAVQLCLSATRLRSLARNAEPIEVDSTIAPLLELGSRTTVLCTSEMVDRPTVIGFFRPRILLSPDLLQDLSLPELHQIVLHEMEHLRRGDQWTNLLQQVSLVLLPWNPAVLWLNRRLCFERELACDDGVMRATKAPRMYAACLVRLAEASMLRRGISLAIGALGALESRARESELVRRVRRILTTAEPHRDPKRPCAAVVAMLAGTLGLSVLLVRSPRLVDFSATPATLATASSEPAPGGMALGGMQAEGPRPTLVKAVVHVRNSGRIVMTGTVLRKHAATRRRTVRAADTAPAIRVPVWRVREPMAGPASPFVTLASAEDSQQLYAAVPWPGGWLLIQL